MAKKQHMRTTYSLEDECIAQIERISSRLHLEKPDAIRMIIAVAHERDWSPTPQCVAAFDPVHRDRGLSKYNTWTDKLTIDRLGEMAGRAAREGRDPSKSRTFRMILFDIRKYRWTVPLWPK